MRVVQRADIISQVQVLCEDPDFALATQPTYVRFIVEGYARLHAAYVAAEPDRYRREQTITVGGFTPGPSFAVPDDWESTVAVDFISGSLREPLRRLQEVDRNRFTNFSPAQSRAYRVIGDNPGPGDSLVLYPSPVDGQEYAHVYLPTAPDDSQDQYDLRMGHERVLQQMVARDLLNAENSYDGRWDGEIDRAFAELKIEANYRYFHDMGRMTSERWTWRPYWPYEWPFGSRW